MKNESLVVLVLLIVTIWLVGLTWGVLDIDNRIKQPQIKRQQLQDTVYIHDTIYLSRCTWKSN